MNGKWTQVKSEGGIAFGKAIGATDEQLEQGKQTKTDLEYTVTGNTIKATRTYTTPAGSKTVSNTAEIGGEGEYMFMEHKIKCAISGSDGDLTLKAVSGWATANAKIVGGQLIETITHHESGVTMTNVWDRA